MGWKLFLRDYASFIVFQLLLVGFIMVLYGLDGFRNVDTAIYSFCISLVLLASFLLVRYLMRQRYLLKISQLPKTMEDVLQKNAKTPEAIQTEKYMHELYRLYQHELHSLYASQKRHDQFMNQWVHQMKTPISVIELLLQDERPLDKRNVQEEIDRLRRGLDMVLVNARLENFEEDMQVEQVALKTIVTATVNENKRLFITKRVFPEIHIEDDIIVASDSKWLRFIIGQFVTNAVKYTFEANKKIVISAVKRDDHVQLAICDEGIGIPASDLSRVTKAFFTGENGRKTGESTGMGLYLAKEICEKLGHELNITSEVGKGTIVTVTFTN
ncbi:sensor histidine kinase [Lysinibacillus pakistanensis]|uniref:histidine kinase n=1 Tax=Lysinibacillus pakistanensis TaxID=759811 RepID=A0AAX3WW74_9BACI|nr:sensor histidine kinase [Lysinibacillus pakistanensis]MDM5230278.1 sensor histidine kinase [Lysinibacillus pakistanensis]WHY45864.1 sensor histidine kinase [Lysinibacillus pakistanensis]WHY50876.1 sensor histidine kinase [Lysinibacillus pakistanensis]